MNLPALVIAWLAYEKYVAPYAKIARKYAPYAVTAYAAYKLGKYRGRQK